MKVMVLGKASAQSEAGEFASPQEFAAMDQFNNELIEAGVLVAADGLQPTSKAKKVSFDVDGNATVLDGPFAEAKEQVAGYSIWEVASMDEAVEWLKRWPARDTVVELRKILDMDDFSETLAAEITAAEETARAQKAARRE